MNAALPLNLAPRLAWSARQWLARAGWPGALGLALLAASAAFSLAATLPRLAERDALRDKSLQMHARARVAQLHPEEKPGRERQLRTFYAFFPAPATLPDWLGRIYAAAQRRGLSLELGQYKPAQEAGARLMRYQVVLPVRGSYAQIRGFVNEVLREVPSASLDDIALKRDNIGSGQIEARLRMTIFLAAAGQ